MEQRDIIIRAANELRAQVTAAHTLTGRALLEALCDLKNLEICEERAQAPLLGGAYARLYIHSPANVEMGGYIWVNETLSEERAIFAIAHELGHFMLHRCERAVLYPSCNESEVDERADGAALRHGEQVVEEYSPQLRRELEANAFAAELLAPAARVRQEFTADTRTGIEQIATRFGISLVLAQRRLQDAVLAAPPIAVSDAEPPISAAAPTDPLAQLDTSQLDAARAPGPALVIAGPGTGKTATLVARAAYLLQQGAQPETILALTFSNRAAGEMRERLMAAGLPGERLPVMTIHAFAALLLRAYPSNVPRAPGEPPLKADFRILDTPDALLLMEDLLGELPLRAYRSLRRPSAHFAALLDDFSQARDNLLTPERYLELVEQMTPAPDEAVAARALGQTQGKAGAKHVEPPMGTYWPEDIAKARERARAYQVWDRALRRRGLVDFGGLIAWAVELLRAAPQVRENVQQRFPQVLVDEFQDTNHAQFELLRLVAGEQGAGLWVVGDRNQSIYRWRGAAPANLVRLIDYYPTLHVRSLRYCYRSVPAIVGLQRAMVEGMAAMADAADALGTPDTAAQSPEIAATLAQVRRPLALLPVRQPAIAPPVLRCETFPSDSAEYTGVAEVVARHQQEGYAWNEQAILCRTNKQVESAARALAQRGIPTAQTGPFFLRPEIKNALALLTLAAGPDARGLLRADVLLASVGAPVPARQAQVALLKRHSIGEEGAAISGYRLYMGHLASTAEAINQAEATLHNGALPLWPPDVCAGLRRLDTLIGALAWDYSGQVGSELTRWLLRPGGYAWRLARVADGLDQPGAALGPGVWRGVRLPAVESAAAARMALAALGELARLAFHFDQRWANEEEFRQRLSHSARFHRRRTHQPPTSRQPALPDALSLPPGSDSLEASASPQAGWSNMPPADVKMAARADEDVEPVSAVRCFLRYLDTLRAAGVQIIVPTGAEDMVRVLTLHASKGLEFPVVYLLGLTRKQFATSGSGGKKVAPPGFREQDEAEAQENLNLFYVGVTRARDVIGLSRALHDAKATRQLLEPAPALNLLAEAPEYQQAAPLLPAEQLATLAEQFAVAKEAQADEADGDGAEDASKANIAGETGTPAPPENQGGAAHRIYSFYELMQYVDCPRQYKYAQCYGLLDPQHSAMRRFHRYIASGRGALHTLRREQPQAEWREAEQHLGALWEEEGPAGHAYAAFYRQSAWGILRDEWDLLTNTASLAGAELERTLIATLKGCRVRITVNRLLPPDPAEGANAPVTLVRVHTGRPKTNDDEDLDLLLYYIAFAQEHPLLPVRIALAYTRDTLSESEARDSTATTTTATTAASLRDVTEKVRQDAEAYLRGKKNSRLNKLDRAALGIERGNFEVRPSDDRCATCAFFTVCPADPEEQDKVDSGTNDNRGSQLPAHMDIPQSSQPS